MIVGAHAVVFSKDPEADRVFFRDLLHLDHVDVGGGWLIFGLPPSEVAFHPSDRNDHHELYLMVDDVHAFITEMARRDVECGDVHTEPWGHLTQLALPGGGRIGVYEPLHERPEAG